MARHEEMLSPFADALGKIETMLKCPICNKLLHNPKLLGCDHIICSKCLPDVDGKRPTCPKCGKVRSKAPRGSSCLEEIIKKFKEMDGAISDIVKQITSDKASICEGTETKAMPHVVKKEPSTHQFSAVKMERCEEAVRILSPFLDSLQKMEMKLKCPVCHNLLEEPKLLSCDHIICRNCLPPIVDDKQPSCPICKKFRPREARASLYVQEMIKIFNEMDGAISDIFKQITSGKASIYEESETQASQPVHKETSHVSVESSSCKEDEAIIFGSVTSNMCNEEQTDEKGTTNGKSCALDIFPTRSSCKIIETNIVVLTAKGSSKKKESESSGGLSGSKIPSAFAAKNAKRRREDENTIGSDKGSKRRNVGDCLKFETMSGKASICEEIEAKEKAPVYKEISHVSVESSSCKEDEDIIFGSVTSNMCNEEQTNAKSTIHGKSCTLDSSPTSSSCEIIETNTVVSTTRGSCKKEEAVTSGGILGSKKPSAVAEKNAKSRKGRNTIGSDKGSKRRILGECLKHETNKVEIKPRSTPINLYDDECAFCHSFRTTELYGPIVCYLNGILVKPEEADQDNVIYVHEKCLEWAPNIYYSGDNVMNLEEEIERGEELICSKCGVKGAVLGCFFGPCRRSYHATCALEIDCSWDSGNFKMLCPAHAFEKLDNFIPDT